MESELWCFQLSKPFEDLFKMSWRLRMGDPLSEAQHVPWRLRAAFTVQQWHLDGWLSHLTLWWVGDATGGSEKERDLESAIEIKTAETVESSEAANPDKAEYWSLGLRCNNPWVALQHSLRLGVFICWRWCAGHTSSALFGCIEGLHVPERWIFDEQWNFWQVIQFGFCSAVLPVMWSMGRRISEYEPFVIDLTGRIRPHFPKSAWTVGTIGLTASLYARLWWV